MTRKQFNIDESIRLIKQYEPAEGYWLGNSGGKDSCCILELAKMAGVKFESHYNVTTIDPPPLVRFIKEHHPETIFDRPEKTFFQMIIKKGFPMRHSRWCCSVFKEKGGNGRTVTLGLRKEESFKRSQRLQYEELPKKKILSPIFNWNEADVWQFIEDKELPYCELYDQGFSRIGCIMCPEADKKNRIYEAMLFPKYVKAFIRTFEKLYEVRKEKKAKSVDRWKSGREMFFWWLGITEGAFEDYKNQVKLFDT